MQVRTLNFLRFNYLSICNKNECNGCENGYFPILVCRVALGDPFITDRRMHGESLGGNDSVIAYDKFKKHPKRMDIFFSEFVISDKYRIYPQVFYFLFFLKT